MKRTISFGKIDFNGCGRRINAVEVELRLRETAKGPEFTASGTIYNSKGTDCICAGQCLDEIGEYLGFPLFHEIHDLWKKYHLNGMHAGTEEQEAAVKAWYAKGNKYDYAAITEYLKSINLYEVEYNGKPYRYGSGWLYREIPEADLNRIKSIINS